MAVQGFGLRIKRAYLEMQSQIGERLSQADFAAMVGKAEAGRKSPYSGPMMTEWISERSVPGLRAFEAMAVVLQKNGVNVSAGELAFGKGEGASAPVQAESDGEAARRRAERPADDPRVKGKADRKRA